MKADILVDFNDVDDEGHTRTLTCYRQSAVDIVPGVTLTAGDDDGNHCPATVVTVTASGLVTLALDLNSFQAAKEGRMDLVVRKFAEAYERPPLSWLLAVFNGIHTGVEFLIHPVTRRWDLHVARQYDQIATMMDDTESLKDSAGTMRQLAAGRRLRAARWNWL